MRNEKITVIIPVYNAQDFIQESIDSILQQTFTDFRLILVNDHSSDSTPQILETNAARDPRITVIHNTENLHISGATNKGLELTDTPYIALMDHDDISLPDRLAKQYAFLENNPRYIVCGGNIEKFGSLTGANRLPTDPQYIDCSMFFSLLFENTTLMMRSDFINKHQLRYNSEFDLCQDYDMLERISRLQPGSIKNIPDILVKKRFFAHNSSLNSLDLHFSRVKKVFARVRRRIFEQDSPKLEQLHTNMWAPKSQNLNAADLDDTLDFVEKLLMINNKKQIYPPDIFSSYCAESYFHLIKEISKKKTLGFACFSRYYKSGIREKYNTGNFEILKLLVRCLK